MENGRMVVDTGVFIDYLRSKDKAKTILQGLPEQKSLILILKWLYGYSIGKITTHRMDCWLK